MSKNKYIKFGSLVLILTMIFSTLSVSGAAIDKESFNLEDIYVRRVWFQNRDTVFKIDTYTPVELAEGLNVTGLGELSDAAKGPKSDGFLAPMKEFFYQMGGSYKEDGDTVTMKLNGDTLVMKAGSADVTLNGTSLPQLPAAGIPQKINIASSTKFSQVNPLIGNDVQLIYLPVRYILDAFQASIYWDSGQLAIYANIKILKNQSLVPALDKLGCSFDKILSLDVASNRETAHIIAQNIVDLQNSDGGWMMVQNDVDMSQSDFIEKLGVKRNSSIELGSTVSEIRFLGKMSKAFPDESYKYADALTEGIQYLLDAQMENGGFSLQKDGIGYNSTIAYGDKAMVNVLTLFHDIARLKDDSFDSFRENNKEMVKAIDKSMELGINCILNTQIKVNDTAAGWSSHHHPVTLDPVIGRTYERPGINAPETVNITEFLMSVRNPSDRVKASIESAVAWLNCVKIKNKKMITTTDITMNNGIDRFLIDEPGHLTWARNYKITKEGFLPFFSDREIARGDIPLMNFDPNDPREVLGTPASGKYYSNYNNTEETKAKIMFYETRTAYEWYVETPNKLINKDYPAWIKYLSKGWPGSIKFADIK